MSITKVIEQKRIYKQVIGDGEVTTLNGNINLTLNQPDTGVVSATFAYENTSLLIGTIPADKLITHTVLIIDTGFTLGTEITVGTQEAQGLLLAAADTIPTIDDSFIVFNNYAVTSETDFKIFISGSPIAGSGKIIIYYS